MKHPTSEQILEHAEGEKFDPAVDAHLRECAQCGAQLAELGQFEAQVASTAPLPPGERARMQAAAERLLRSRAPAAAPKKLFWWALGAAAAVAVTAFVWPMLVGSPPAVRCEIVRSAPEPVVRAEPVQRFHLSVTVPGPRWLAVWQLGERGDPLRLLPRDDPLLRYLGSTMPLLAGSHRLPAIDVLDFEFKAAEPPAALVLVPWLADPTMADLRAIEAVIAATAVPQLESALRRVQPEAVVVAFPP